VIDPLRRNEGITGAIVDGSGIEYCNGAGLGLLVEIDRIVRSRMPGEARPDEAGERGAEFRGLGKELSRLLEHALPRKPIPPRARRLGVVEQVGAATKGIVADIAAIVAFLGEVTAAFAWALMHPRRVRWRDVLLVAEKAGANAVPVVVLLGWLVGLIISFQSAPPLQRFAAESTIPNLLSVSVVRELGPLFTAIILAGRSGSAFAAEIGTMKVTEEVNALTTFGLDPVRFLVVPRVLAAVLMVPLLSIMCTVAALVGGYIIMAMLGYGLAFYVNEVNRAVDYVDLLQGLVKSGVFAFLICGIGCLRGLRTGAGPGAVGDSTTRAVVAGIILTVAADGVLGVVFYFAGV
jgi:phospholipid/cholesterol/gamma-HCH transport system permease protein